MNGVESGEDRASGSEPPPQPPRAPPPKQAASVETPPEAGDAAGGGYRARAQEPAAVLLAADILRWSIPTVAKFPKNYRFGLGARIEAALTDVLEDLVTAQYAKAAVRRDALARANLRLQVLRHLARMAVELKIFSARQGIYLAGLLVELGKQIGGWHKASATTDGSSRSSANRPS